MMRKMARLTGWRGKFGNSLHAHNTQHTKRHSLLWENKKQTEVGVKWLKIISRSSILHWSRAIGWTQKECRMPRYLKSLALGQAAGFYHIPIRSVGQHRCRHFQHISRLSTQSSKIFPMFPVTLSADMGMWYISVTNVSIDTWVRTKARQFNIVTMGGCGEKRSWSHQNLMIGRSTALLPQIAKETIRQNINFIFSLPPLNPAHWDVDNIENHLQK